MRPLALTLAGTALGLSAVLPLARQLADPAAGTVRVVEAAAGPSALVTAPVRPAVPAKETAQKVTADGPAVTTRYGPVQVRVVLTDGRLTSVESLRLPDGDGESRQINRHAGPVLARRAVAAQGSVDTVSGATWTSNGYRRSLQAALDAARAAATSTPPPLAAA